MNREQFFDIKNRKNSISIDRRVSKVFNLQNLFFKRQFSRFDRKHVKKEKRPEYIVWKKTLHYIEKEIDQSRSNFFIQGGHFARDIFWLEDLIAFFVCRRICRRINPWTWYQEKNLIWQKTRIFCQSKKSKKVFFSKKHFWIESHFRRFKAYKENSLFRKIFQISIETSAA